MPGPVIIYNDVTITLRHEIVGVYKKASLKTITML